jgi:hypothetical protein
MIRSEHEPRELNTDTVLPDAQYNTTRYEPREIGLQYNTYMYGKPCTVHTIRGSYCVSSVSMVLYDTIQHDTNRERYNPAQYDTTWYDTTQYELQEIGLQLQCIHVRQTLHSTWSMVRTVFLRGVQYAPRYFTIRSAVRTVFSWGIIWSYFKF